MRNRILFRCSFCGNPFKSEKRFLKHQCKEMERDKQFRTVAGAAAWSYYKTWMKAKHNNTVTESSTFKKSSYFVTFYKFVDFVKRANMPDVNMFITLMVKNRIDPKSWQKNEAYSKYLEFMTHSAPVGRLVEISVKTILDIAEVAGVEPNEIFDVLTAPEVIQLLHQRKLSPWVLLHSKKFADFYINGTNSEEQLILKSLISADYWKSKFKRYPKDVETVRDCIAEMEL